MKEKSPGRAIKVGILIPSTGMWISDFGVSLASMINHTCLWRPDPSEGFTSLQIHHYVTEGSMLVTNRQRLIGRALKDGCTHMLFLDTDMVFPNNTLVQLLLHKKACVGVNYPTRSVPSTPVAHGLDGKACDTPNKTGLEQVQFLGMGCVLLEAEPIKRLSLPLFMMEWIPELRHHCGEDVYFFSKLQEEAGVKIWLDHDLSKKVKHIGKYSYSWDLVREDEEAVVKENTA